MMLDVVVGKRKSEEQIVKSVVHMYVRTVLCTTEMPVSKAKMEVFFWI